MKKDLFKICGLAVLFCLFAFAGSLSAQNTTVNKTETFKVQNGNCDYTWPVPTEVDGNPITVTYIRFEAIGGGGAGGYIYDHKGGEAASGGGGGGAYAYLEVANPQETSYTIHVGKGGTSIANSRTNTNGGASTVSGTNGMILRAAGGMTVVPTNHGTISTNYYTFDGASGGQVANCIPQANATAGGNGSRGSYGLFTTQSGAGGNAAGPQDLAGRGGNGNSHSYALSDGYTGNPGGNYGGGGSGAQGYSVRVGRNIESNGGTGADGVVRVTYSYETNASATAENVDATVCSDVAFSIPLAINLTNLTPEQVALTTATVSNPELAITGLVSTYENGQFVMKGTMENNSNPNHAVTHSVVYNVEYQGTVLATANVNFTVYAPLTAGTLSEPDTVCNMITLTMGEATGGSGEYTYGWQYSWYVSGTTLNDWQDIEGANALNYTISSPWERLYRGSVTDVNCAATAYTTASEVLQVISPSQTSGSIDRNDTAVCPNHTYSTTLYANVELVGSITIKWQRKYNDNEWQDVISHGPSHGAGSYNVRISSSQFDTVNTASYRFLVKAHGCDEYIPCNDVFTVTKKEFPSYEDQFEAVTITLPYGECTFNIDSLKAPELPETEVDTVYVAEDQEKNLAPSETPYKVVWNVVDVVCGVITTDTQLVTVQFPVCGEGLIAEDAENNSYTTVRIGCDCWMAENLRTSAANAVYYDEDAENADFGMLYSLADVFPPVRATSPENAPIQGICPEGWAVPTLAQYNAMMAVAGSVENLKATTGWLPEYVGNNETGFSAMAPGFYNASADQFQKHLTFAGFWTSSSSDVAGTGVIFEINYNCDNGTPSGAPEANKYSVRCVKVNEE